MTGKASLQAVRQIMNFMTKSKGFDKVCDKLHVVSAEDGHVVCEMKVEEEHANRAGTLHGGLTATLVDVVSTCALMTRGDGTPGVSVDLSVSYMKAAPTCQEIIIEATTLRAGRTLAFCNVDLKSKADGTLLAQGKHTKFIGR